MTPQIVIGVMGLKGSGKSVVARYLSREHGFSRRPFAFYLKAMLHAIGIPTDILDGSIEDKAKPLACLNGHTARHAMQTLGTEWGRKCMGENFWVDIWKTNMPNYGYIVVDDVRFPNEVQAIHDLGGVIVKVVRPGLTLPKDAHASEQIDDLPWDFLFTNDGTIAELEMKAQMLIANIEERNSCQN